MNTITSMEQFRQIKQLIQDSPSKVIVIGLDVGKHRSVACIADARKNMFIKKLRISNTAEGLNLLIQETRRIHRQKEAGRTIAALEPTGNYHKPLANYFNQHQIAVVGILTVAAKENRKSLDGRWKKTDPRDAYNIVDMVSQNKFFFYQQDSACENLRDLVRLRARLACRLSSVKIRIRNNHLSRFFPEMDSLYRDILNQEVISTLAQFPAADDINACSFEEFQNKVQHRRSSTLSRNRIKNVWSLAKHSLGCRSTQASRLGIELILEEASLIQKQIQKTDRQIQRQCQTNNDYALLQTLPGYGPWVAATFLAYIGNIKNYSHPRQISKRVGLDLEYVQSGNFHGQARISKKGNSLLRYSLCSAAIKAMRNPMINTYYQRTLIKKGDSPSSRAKLRIKLTDKLLRAAFAVLKKQQPFDITHFVHSAMN